METVSTTHTYELRLEYADPIFGQTYGIKSVDATSIDAAHEIVRASHPDAVAVTTLCIIAREPQRPLAFLYPVTSRSQEAS